MEKKYPLNREILHLILCDYFLFRENLEQLVNVVHPVQLESR
jgi:hypothetical protein